MTLAFLLLAIAGPDAITLQQCGPLASEMRQAGASLAVVTDTLVQQRCAVEGCDPACVAVHVAGDVDDDGDLDLIDYAAWQVDWRTIDDEERCRRRINLGAFPR
ncbi:MAG: hypothetical protein ACKV2Q_36655 [Planctomycetaceae bacterium]